MSTIKILFLSALLLAASSFAQKAPPRADLAAAPAKTVSTPAPASKAAIDEDLLIDDNDKDLLAADKKSVPAAVDSAVHSANKPAVPSQPAAPVDSSKKKLSAPAGSASADSAATKAPAVAAPHSSKTLVAAKDSVKKASDEELILDDGEEDLLSQVKAAPPKAPAARSDSTLKAVGGVTPAKAIAGNPVAGAASPLTSGQNDTGKTTRTIPSPAVAAAQPSATAAPVIIEKVHSINFARNLKEYRSPKLAMLLSLLVPGAGQLYAKADIWAAGFIAVEAAVITTGAVMSAKANRIKKDAHTYADQHYDAKGKFKPYTDTLLQLLTDKFGPDSAKSIFTAITTTYGSDSAFLANGKNDEYYTMIQGGSPFIRGWDDVQPAFGPGGFDLSTSPQYRLSDSAYYFMSTTDSNHLFGVSAHQGSYNGMLDESGKWANYSRDAFISLLINHLASAIMAGIEAKAHNDALLGKESFWQHIGIEEQYVNTGSEKVQGYALQVRF